MRRVNRFTQDMHVDEDALSFDVIKAVGPGGEFLTATDTLQKVRTHSWNSEPDIDEQAAGKTFNDQFLENVHLKLQNMLENYQKPELDTKIQKRLENYLVGAGIDPKVIDAINEDNVRGNHDLWQS